MSQYFPKPYELFGGDINVKVDLSNYATKPDLQNVSHVDVSSFTLKSNLFSLKTEVDKLDINKLTPVPNDLAKLSNVVKNDVAKKAEYNANNASIQKILKQGSGVARKNDLDAVENKISIVSGFHLTAVFNSKITKVENKVPSLKT